MEKILAGISGGVDSSLAASLLLEQGYDVTGGTLTLFDSKNPLYGGLENTDLSDAAAVCSALGIEHKIIDLSDDFKFFVIENFVSEYLGGRTPNPCTVCNKMIKFGKMLSAAKSFGCEKIATGHYARIQKQGERYLLLKAADKTKDQSYMLYTLSQAQLSAAVFPLGNLEKTKVRELAEGRKIITSRKKDSQDICFIKDGHYAEFIEAFKGFRAPEGDFCNEEGELLGRHAGIIRYTEGQRKGLGVAVGHPIYVIKKDVQNNRVILGEEERLFGRRVFLEEINLIALDSIASPIRVTAKLRYRHAPAEALLSLTETGAVLEFSEPQRAPTPGQAAVFYDGDIVIGGGKISSFQ